MTPYETVQMVRMLLDDQIDYALSNATNVDINTYINDAQIKTISKYYRLQDERALRPLNIETYSSMNGLLLGDFLYPRSCHIYVNGNINRWKGINAQYVEYGEFLNEDSPEIGPNNNQATPVISIPALTGYPILNTDTARMPVTSKWTVAQPGGDNAFLLFTRQTGLESARVIYIGKPVAFRFDPLAVSGGDGLSLPKEYHYEIAALAAHLITMSDVNEFQRESSEYAGAKLDFNTMRL